MKKLLILLLLSTSFSTFADSHLDFSLSDFCYLQPSVQDREGIYYFQNEEVGISATSICVYKDAYGQYFSKGNLKKGKFDGKWTFWNENGQKDYEVNYKTEYSYYDNGQIESEENYTDNMQNGIQIFWYDNGQIGIEANYKDDKRDGKSTSWYDNGQKLSEGHYKDGKEDGKLTMWDETGKKILKRKYKDGVCISGDC